MGDADELDPPGGELRVELVEIEPAVVVDGQVVELRALLLAQELPGNDVRVVLHLRDQHHVAGGDVLPPPGEAHEVDRLGDVAGEDRLLELAADELRDPLLRPLI